MEIGIHYDQDKKKVKTKNRRKEDEQDCNNEDELDCNDIDVVVGCNHTWGLPNAVLNNKNETKCPPFTGNLFLILVFYPILVNEKSDNLDFL